MIIGLFLLNIVDLIATSYFVNKLGIAVELNPAMHWLLGFGIPVFALFKLIAGFGACLIFWKLLERGLAKFGIIIAFVMYLLLALYHLVGTLYYILS